MFRIGGDYAVVTFTKPFIQNMSRHDVLEDKLTQTLWEEERIVDFSLNHSSSRFHSPHKRQNTNIRQVPSSIKRTDSEHT